MLNTVKLARNFTKKNIVVKFDGCYHGNVSEFISGRDKISIDGNDVGINNESREIWNVRIGEYNNFENIINILNKYKDEIAAIIVEPVATHMGLVAPKQGFLELLRIITQNQNVVLIFDETTTGFRVKFDCAQGHYRIKPDLTIFGKVIGGGMTMGAYGGSKEIMECFIHPENMYHTNLISTNPISLAAGIRTLEILKDDLSIYKRIDRKATMLEKSFVEIARKYGSRIRINRIGSMLTTFFNDNQVVNFENSLNSNLDKYSEYYKRMLSNNIYLSPSQFDVMFVSDAHTDDDIEKTIKAFEVSIKGISTGQ
jgi:glutamate-1-semialdehyde 2,1-aminomutase